jgi:hypothetical protein
MTTRSQRHVVDEHGKRIAEGGISHEELRYRFGLDANTD